MRGADLRCVECGGFAIDVHPDYRLKQGGWWRVWWTCSQGHDNMTGAAPDAEPGMVTTQRIR